MCILIKGMKMPESPVLFCIHPDGKVFADLEGGWREYKAVTVPDHGRLGDLDKLERMFADIDNAPYSGFDGEDPFYSAEDAAQIIRLAPTVIPADEVV